MQPYYQHGGVTIYHADCLMALADLPAVFDLVFTSPPYNLGNTTTEDVPGKDAPRGHYSPDTPLGSRGGRRATNGNWPAIGAGKGERGKWDGGALATGYRVHNDAMPHAEYVAWQQDVLRACWRVLSPTGAIFYNHKPRILHGRCITPLEYVPPDLLPYLRQIIIWARAGGINSSPAFYLSTHEWLVILAQPAFRLRDRSASGVGDVWYVPQEADLDHPAPFPRALPLRAIETTGARMVLDPFMGRGTTLRAAKDLGADAVGIDNSEPYCRLAVRHLQQEVLPLEVA